MDQTVNDLEYDLVTTLSNILQGREVLSKYARDADQAGDSEAAEVFRSIQANNDQAAMRLRSCIQRVMG